MYGEKTHHALMTALTSRRSVRQYRPDPIDRSVIESILTAATWAPSAHNRQPWRFAVVEDAEQKEVLAAAMGMYLRQDLEADGVPEKVIADDVGRSYARITSAPVAVVLCLSMRDMDVYPDGRRNRNEHIMAVQSVAMCGQNLLLAAHHAGLGACWMCAPLFCPDVIRAVLDLPSDWHPQGLVTLGYPGETREKARKPLEGIMVWR